MTTDPSGLLGDLASAHDFTGAPCVGEWLVMDTGGPDALALCARCPQHHHDACSSVLASLPLSSRTGTWAGTTYSTTNKEN